MHLQIEASVFLQATLLPQGQVQKWVPGNLSGKLHEGITLCWPSIPAREEYQYSL